MESLPENPSKRKFLKSLLALPALFPATLVAGKHVVEQSENKKQNLKISLNAYSFNEPLSNGSMTLVQLLEFCAERNLPAVDITAYYFPGYPDVPADDYLYNIKREAFRLGVEISGTGVRNDFTEADARKRSQSVKLVKHWIDAAQKIGAPVIRIFSGNQKPSGFTRAQILEWMISDIQECVDYGKAHGVIIGLQNHDDFLKTAADVIEIMEHFDSDWFGLILDTGSYRTADPYEEIARTIKYAVNWQVKEKIFVQGKEVDVDLTKLFSIIKASSYRGYLPLETLGKGDPNQKVSAFQEKLNTALNQSR